MRAERTVVVSALVIGLLAWVVDAVLDYFIFYRGESFGDLLLAWEYEHELYIRSVILLIFAAYGIVVSRVMSGRRRIEEVLRESEERFRSLFENAPLGYQSLDEQGDFIEVNEAWCSTLGFTKEQVIGRNFSEFIHPDFKEHFKENFPKFKGMGYILGVEFEMIRKDGSEIIVSFDGRIGHAPDGSFKQTHCVLKDITQQRQTQQELHEAHEELEERVRRRTAELAAANERLALFERFVETSVEGMGWADLQGNVRYLNPALCRMFGEARPEDAYGKPVLQYYDEPTQQKIREEIFPAVLQGRGWTGDMVIQSSEGQSGKRPPTPTSNALIALRDSQGEPIGFANVLTDLTERKRHEAELQEHHDHLEEVVAERTAELKKTNQELQEEIAERERVEADLRERKNRYEAAISASGNILYDWDANTNEVIYGGALEPTLGYTTEEMAGGLKCWRESIHTDDLDHFDAAIRRLVETRESAELQYRVRKKDGDYIFVEDSGRFFLDAKGDPTRMVGFVKDVTQRRLAEEERERLIERLEAQNAELERFTYTVSHDLKSPLITLKGYLGLLKEDLVGERSETVEDDISRMAGAADKMGRLLEELLELSRIGRVVTSPKDVPLGELAREALELVEGRIAEGDVQVDVAADLPVIFGDRPRLLEVLQNLIDNAAKYMGDQARPRIEIGARLVDGETICYVRDNGVGVDPRYHQKIFGLFDQLDQKAEGTGIGLALVKRIVEVHGGRIWVESEGRQEGSTFCFTLPPRRERKTE